MKRYFNIYTLAIAAIMTSLMACETNVTVPFPEHEKKIVINSFPREGEVFEAYITRSYGALESVEEKDILVSDAFVQLWEDNVLVDTLVYKDTTQIDTIFFGGGNWDIIMQVQGKYVSENIVTQAGKTYELKVTHPLYPTASAISTIPSKPQISDASIEQNTFRQGLDSDFGRYTSDLKLMISDPGSEVNYYSVRVGITYEHPEYFGEFITEEIEVLGIKDETDVGANSDEFFGEVIISDETFDGQNTEVIISCLLPNAYDDVSEIEEYNITAIHIQLIGQTKDYFQYIDKLLIQERSANSGLDFFPSEAVVVYSNVTDGYGIFAGSNAVFRTFE